MRRTLQWFFIFLFLLAVGIASGSFFEVFLYGSGKDSLAETLNIFLTTPQEMLKVFPHFLRQICLKTITIAVLLLTVPFIPPLMLCFPLIIFVKGFSLGFTVSMTFETLGLAGIRQIALTMFFGKLIQLPLLCLLCAYAAETATQRKGNYKVHKIRIGNKLKPDKSTFRRYTLVCLCGLFLYLISFLPEAFLLS
ncbi:MAG: hypothetical protein ACLUJC_06570 [Clostridia bacterium]